MPPFSQLRDFTTPGFGHNTLRFAFARKDATNRNQYMLVCALPYGMAYDQRIVTLNRSTTAAEADAPTLSPSKHPIIFFDCNFDPNPTIPRGLLGILLQAEPPVIRLTGNSRKIHTELGAPKLVPEVEILMGEDDLAHMCCYCGAPEFIELAPRRFKRCNNDPAQPQYICSNCEDQTKLTRSLRWVLKRYWLGGLELAS
ncbi:hypothetical protein FOMPIDRAFT_1055348 [Fomitopsis schrenkii]|uniref:Uncharacterized protein n=1 Tax=Fomitopsis schrenkii TaxID=2126942 RepID=S8DSI2_FOMSC|nr:hypothetical protein FOMPIDRAFT_1055348 [Fomitopsis schrenkii]